MATTKVKVRDINDLLDVHEFDEVSDYWWMELGDIRKVQYKNPFLEAKWENKEDIVDNIVDFCRDDEYLHFFVKYFLNIDLLPYQSVTLQTLWHKSMAMLIATRGGGKSFMLALYVVCRAVLHQGCKIAVVGASLRQSMVIFNYVQMIWDNAPILQDICGKGNHPKRDLHMSHWKVGTSQVIFLPLGNGEKIRGQRANVILADEFSCLSYDTLVETNKGILKIGDIIENDIEVDILNKDGNWEKPTKYIKTPKTDVYEIITRNGYSFKCSSIHQVMTTNGWKLAKDLNNDDYLIFNNNYQFPEEYLTKDEICLNEDLGWLFGLLISEGTLTNENYIGITTTDTDLKDRLLSKFDYLNIKNYNYQSYYDHRFDCECKPKYELRINSKNLRNKLYKLGLDFSTAHGKRIPWSILQSPKSVILSFLSGLFEGDGSAFQFNNRKKSHFGIAYYSVNEDLISDLQVLLSKLDIISNKQSRKSNLSDNLQWMLRINGKYAKNLYYLLNIPKWDNIYDGSFVHEPTNKGVVRRRNKYSARPYYKGKTHYLGDYDTKEECQNIINDFWNQHSNCLKVKSVKLLGVKEHLYDFYLPETNSFYGNGFIQHNSIPSEVFETVVRGFGSVKSDNTFNSVVDAYKRQLMKEYGMDEYLDAEEMSQVAFNVPTMLDGNQLVVSGTVSYQFNHFYKYYQYYKAIIQSGGNKDILKKDFPDMPLLDDIDPTNFAIIRIPCEFLPPGMMDEAFLAQGRATMDPAIYNMEYHCIFQTDSVGFYLASSLQAATCPIFDDGRGGKIDFAPKLVGENIKKYVMGIDPASEDDKFSISIIERNKGYRGLVYQWSTNRPDFEDLKRNKVIRDDINDYNTFCVKHVRDLLERFNIEMIIMDAGGGGVSMRELLKDSDKLLHSKDELVYDMDDIESRSLPGKHILKMIEFQNYDWRINSHYGLKKDIIDKILLFPSFDVANMAIASYEDKALGKVFDTIEDAHLEIEQAKQETAMIRHFETPNGRETWGIPKITGIDAEQVKKTLKRDRFTSLLLANWGCRLLDGVEEISTRSDRTFGGVAKELAGGGNMSVHAHTVSVEAVAGGRRIYY